VLETIPDISLQMLIPTRLKNVQKYLIIFLVKKIYERGLIVPQQLCVPFFTNFFNKKIGTRKKYRINITA